MINYDQDFRISKIKPVIDLQDYCKCIFTGYYIIILINMLQHFFSIIPAKLVPTCFKLGAGIQLNFFWMPDKNIRA